MKQMDMELIGKEEEHTEKRKKKKNKQTYKINIDETKHRFLSELIYLYFFELK